MPLAPSGTFNTPRLRSSRQIMALVMLACLPALVTHCYYFGWGMPLQLLLTVTTALLTEGMVLIVRDRPLLQTLYDGSALLTALLLAFCLPPLAPWWIAVIGTFCAVVIAKQLYGGLGHNLFNPAMVGYVILLISFPLQMSTWLPPKSMQGEPITFYNSCSAIFSGTYGNTLSLQPDTISQPTPLDIRKSYLLKQKESALPWMPLQFNRPMLTAWQAINGSFLLGGVLLLIGRVIPWQIPISYLLILSLSALLGSWWQPLIRGSALFHLSVGATLLGAFFIATDPVTAATSRRGQLIFGGLIGGVVYLIREVGGYPDGVAFAVLIGNMSAPLIDAFTRPRVYGASRRH